LYTYRKIRNIFYHKLYLKKKNCFLIPSTFNKNNLYEYCGKITCLVFPGKRLMCEFFFFHIRPLRGGVTLVRSPYVVRCTPVHEHDESPRRSGGGGEGRCAFRAGLRVGRARRCVDRGSPIVGGVGRGTTKIPWTDRERAWQGAHCICGMTFIVLSLTTCDAIRWSLLPLSTVVIASVAAVARAWRFLCAGPKTSHASSVSRRSRAAEKLALSLVGKPLRVLRACARVRVNICHMAPPTLHYAVCSTLAPRQLSSSRQKCIFFFYFINFNYYS